MIRQGPIDFKKVGPATLVAAQYIRSSDCVTTLFDACGDATQCQLRGREAKVDYS
jgi:hypothetical protein